MAKGKAAVGVADHGGWAVLVTVAGGALIDRRRVELVDRDLPKIPHHHQGQMLPLPEAVALVERVRASAHRCARERLEELAAAVPIEIAAIALRRCPPLPPTVAERITDYRASNVADWVMYREAIAEAAKARAWSVEWYDPKTVFREAAQALVLDDIEDHLREIGRSLGPPWQKDHRIAMAAALAVT